MNAAQVNQHKYLRKFVQMKEEYQKAGTNVSRERDILVPATMQKDVERSLLALEETKDITKECVKILCELSAQDVATLRRWLNMSSEKSVHEGKVNVGLKKNGNRRREEDAERKENNGRTRAKTMEEVRATKAPERATGRTRGTTIPRIEGTPK